MLIRARVARSRSSTGSACGALPVCYKSEQEGRYLYIIDGALSAFNYGQAEDDAEPGAGGVDGRTPRPAPCGPCIQHTAHDGDGARAELDVAHREARSALAITAESRERELQTRRTSRRTNSSSSWVRCCVCVSRRCRWFAGGARGRNF